LNALTDIRMLVEATLDFPEEEFDVLQRADVAGKMSGVLRAVEKIHQNARQGALLREGIKVVIAGQPNAGKSSLLNALAGAELAIVSPIAGTTRDKVAQTIQIEGVPVHVIDTAGLRDSDDEVEKMGVARAWAEINTADAVLFLHDLTQLDPCGTAVAGDPFTDASVYRDADRRIAASLASRLSANVPVVDVWNKLDVAEVQQRTATDTRVYVSTRTGEGLDSLRQTLLHLAGWQALPEGVYMARERHVQALDRVRAHLSDALGQSRMPSPALDLMAEDLRLTQNALSEITGAFGADDLLGVIFSRFCIGK